MKMIEKNTLLREIKVLQDTATDLYGCSQFDTAYKNVIRAIENIEVKEVDTNKVIKPTEWSEEDERIHQCLIRDQEKSLDDVRNNKYGHSEIISDLKEMYRERIAWLKSLKKRIGE